jgi:hypothetical protein
MSENLNCPFCGCELMLFITKNNLHPKTSCRLSGWILSDNVLQHTPDPLKEKVEKYRNNLEQGLIWHSDSPYREGLLCAKERFDEIFGEKE